jgi:hypothetical protein
LRGLRRGAGDEVAPAARTLRQLAWTWLLVITVFFSLPQSKLVGYIFPASFPLALLAAEAFARAVRPASRLQTWWRASAGVAVCACVAGVVFAAVRPAHSSRAIGVALRHAGPGDRVVFVKDYWFDVPVYAALRRPVFVVDDWSDATVASRDNWRKELADAARFDRATGSFLLLSVDDAAQVLCAPATTWVVGTDGTVDQFPVLLHAKLVASQRNVRLWRLDPGESNRTGCPAGGYPQLAEQP